MESPKGKDPANSGAQGGDPDADEAGRAELCPGFRDVDAFVKVS